MDPSKNKPSDVNFDIGGDPYDVPPTPDFREDRGAQKLAADAIIGMLPTEYKQRIFAITKARGMNRSSRRATKALVTRGIRQAKRNTNKLTARAYGKEARDFDLFLRIEKRIARGLDKPLPGMTSERYEAIKVAFGRVESLKIDGQEVEQLGGAIVRMKDQKVIVQQTR